MLHALWHLAYYIRQSTLACVITYKCIYIYNIYVFHTVGSALSVVFNDEAASALSSTHKLYNCYLKPDWFINDEASEYQAVKCCIDVCARRRCQIAGDTTTSTNIQSMYITVYVMY